MIIDYLEKLSFLFEHISFILLGCLGMGFLIGFHELGHFMFAKLFGIRVPSFSLGFGPVLFSKKIGQTEFCLSAIPFGGYVEIAGAGEVGQGEQKEAHATDKGSFAVKPFYQKLCVMLGGIFFNLIFAYCAIILLFMTGIPKTPLMQRPFIASIAQDSPAEKSALRIGDRIISLNDHMVENNIQKLAETLRPLALTQATITIERDGQLLTKTIIIGSKQQDAATIGVIGVEFDNAPITPRSFFQAIKDGITATNNWIKLTAIGFTQLRRTYGEVAGPIMIIAMTAKGAAAGFKIFLLLLSIISINLAVLNLIPLPILDGGQILFYAIEAIIGRPLPIKIREYIHIATWLMFVALFIYLSTQDISRILSPYIDPILKYLKIR